MTRSFTSFSITDFQHTKLQMLNWANRFDICCFLDNHQYNGSHHSVECLLAAGSVYDLNLAAGTAFQQLELFFNEHKDWLFGHLSYDLKNEIEPLSSLHFDGVRFPDLFFFVPETILLLSENELNIGLRSNDHSGIHKQIVESGNSKLHAISRPVNIRNRVTKEYYLNTIRQLKEHIHRGDCYEINFCQECYAEGAMINPLELYGALSKISPNPFSAFYKMNNHYLLCASPERYLKKTGNTLLSQPIKGTWQRDLGDADADKKNKDLLLNSIKDRSENVMVVDLVRNDLSKISKGGSVNVDELFGIYSFPQVHQMISTVRGEISDGLSWVDALKATFPMGSMTGAPKRRVMELIEQYEWTRRGAFSGALGYVTPAGDFDFNVIIRSILYNGDTNYLSFHTGSGITFLSDPENEYEECILKMSAIKKVLADLANTF